MRRNLPGNIGREPPAAGTTGLTYADYCALPDDGLRYEILEGLLVSEPSPRVPHQVVAANLLLALSPYAKSHDLGKVFIAPVDVILSASSVVVPDLVFVSRDRLGIVNDRGLEGAPDLIVEIISPSTARRDRVAKLRLYARHGIRHYWLADPETRILEALELVDGSYRVAASLAGDETFEPALFPGLTLSLAELWG